MTARIFVTDDRASIRLALIAQDGRNDLDVRSTILGNLLLSIFPHRPSPQTVVTVSDSPLPQEENFRPTMSNSEKSPRRHDSLSFAVCTSSASSCLVLCDFPLARVLLAPEKRGNSHDELE